MKKNCWEFKKCGREPGGINADKLGVCKASTCAKLNKSNSGVNGGRSCCVIAGTFCGGKPQGSFAQKLIDCMKCDFYKSVYLEEKETDTLESSNDLLDKLE